MISYKNNFFTKGAIEFFNNSIISEPIPNKSLIKNNIYNILYDNDKKGKLNTVLTGLFEKFNIKKMNKQEMITFVTEVEFFYKQKN